MNFPAFNGLTDFNIEAELLQKIECDQKILALPAMAHPLIENANVIMAFLGNSSRMLCDVLPYPPMIGSWIASNQAVELTHFDHLLTIVSGDL